MNLVGAIVLCLALPANADSSGRRTGDEETGSTARPGSAPPTRAAAGNCQGKTGSTWIRCVVDAGQADALENVLEMMGVYPYVVPDAAAKLALLTGPQCLLDLARQADEPSKKSAGLPKDRTILLKGSLAALGALLQRVRTGLNGPLPRDLGERMLAFCASHATDPRARIAEQALECVRQVHDESATRALCSAVQIRRDDSNVVTALSALNERQFRPDPALSRRLLELVARPLDRKKWTQPQAEQKDLACRLLLNRPDAPNRQEREEIMRAIAAVAPLQSQVADACGLLLAVRGPSPAGVVDGTAGKALGHRELAFPYVVRADDTIRSINARFGMDPFATGNDIFTDPLNAQLRRENPDPDRIKPGSLLWIPDYGQWLAIRFMRQAREPFRLFFEGIEVEGSFMTDRGGAMKVAIPAMLKEVQLALSDSARLFHLKLNAESPDSVAGIQQLLGNLGFAVKVTGELDQQTRQAIGKFQSTYGLEKTNDLSDETRMRLIDECSH